jgi:hypothetical protein
VRIVPPDIAAAVPLVVGVVVSSKEAAPAETALRAFETVLGDLQRQFPQTPLALLTELPHEWEHAVVRVAELLDVAVIPCVAAAAVPEGSQPNAVDRPPKIVDGDARLFIAHACDILVTLANAAAPADLLVLADRRRTGEPRPAGQPLLTPRDVGPCYTIEGASVAKSFPMRSAGDQRAETEFFAGLARRNRFNADVTRQHDTASGTTIERLRARIAHVTDGLQVKTNAFQIALYGLALVAASFEIFPTGLIGTYLKFGALSVAFIIYFFVRREKYQSRYQDYRAISEALRVQAVWSRIGVAERVEDSYLPMQQTDLQWIRNVLRVVNSLDTPQADAKRRDAVLDWVTGQHDYFFKHSRIEAKNRDFFLEASSVFGALSVVSSLATLGLFLARGGKPPETLTVDLGIIAGLSALFVAAARSYARTRGHGENANRYQRMFFVFERALEVLNGAAVDEARTRAVAVELGRVALAEHAEWLLAQRERPITLVATSAA